MCIRKSSVNPKKDMQTEWNAVKDPQKERKKTHVEKNKIGKKKDFNKDRTRNERNGDGSVCVVNNIMKDRKEGHKANSNDNGLKEEKKRKIIGKSVASNNEKKTVRFQEDENHNTKRNLM